MRVAVIRFPGSNCDQDALWSLRRDVGVKADLVWYEATSLEGFDGVFLPGGFSYGDYLRCGAMAAMAPVMAEIKRFADAGRPVIGACNGFQVLCEAHLLPGALLLNADQKFICQDVFVRAENRSSIWTKGCDGILRIPIAHGEGRYICAEQDLEALEDKGQVAFRYVSPSGEMDEVWNVNGSMNAIAGILNPAGNVLGMMPHPERISNPMLGGIDGLSILNALTLVNA